MKHKVMVYACILSQLGVHEVVPNTLLLVAERVGNVASALKHVKAGPHGALLSLSIWLVPFIAQQEKVMCCHCRQDWHVCHQLPRVDACVASVQPKHTLLW